MPKIEQGVKTEQRSFSSDLEVPKLSAAPNFEVRLISCDELAIKKC